MTNRPDSPERKRDLAKHLHAVAAESRKSAAEMDQMAARIIRRLRPEGAPIPCCESGPCMLCGIESPGHVHVYLPDSHTARRIVIGRICSSHTFSDVIQADKFLVYIEGEVAAEASRH